MFADSIRKKFAVSENHFFVIALFTYLVLSLVKMRAYLFSGRFWAEEGKYFYADIAQSGFFKGLVYVFNGHIEFMTNAVVAASTLVPLKWAPLITTYSSYLLQFIPIALLLKYRNEFSLNRYAVFGVVIIAAGMPQAAEVWANAINLHFHFALLVALIAALPITAQNNTWLFRVLLLAAGLSGIPANFLLPILFFQALRERHRERWIQVAILGACCAMQLAVIATQGLGDRKVSFGPITYLMVALAQHEYALVFTAKKSLRATRHLANIFSGDTHALATAAVGVAFFAAFLYRSLRHITPARIMVVAAMVLSLLSFATAIGDKTQMISPAGGGRYFYASNLLFVIALFSLLRTQHNKLILIACVAITLIAAKGVKTYIKGPDWHREYEQASSQHLDTINIWPTGWIMKYPYVNAGTNSD